MADITLEQVTHHETVRGVFSQVKSTGTLFQDFFGLRAGSPGTDQVSGMSFGWDIFNNTRTLAGGRAPDAPAATVRPKPIGHVTAQALRMFEKIILLDSKLFNMRPLGGNIGTIDKMGQSYAARQYAYIAKRFQNAMEFMISRMFRGGFSIKISGDDHILIEYQATGAVVDVNYRVPATHLGTMELGTGATMFPVSWADPAASIVDNIYAMDEAQERECGWPFRHIFVDGLTFAKIQNNTQLRNITGTSNRVFASLTQREIGGEEINRSTAYDVVFGALPLHTFHVYNAVLNVDKLVDSTTVANSSKMIPYGKAIFTPDPSSDWIGKMTGSEPIRRNVMSGFEEARGFTSWPVTITQPAGHEMNFLEIALPILRVPAAIGYGTVIFP